MALPPRNFQDVDERFHAYCGDCPFCKVLKRIDEADDPTFRAEVALRPGALFNKYQVGGDLATMEHTAQWVKMAELFVREAYASIGLDNDIPASPTRHIANKLMIEIPSAVVSILHPNNNLMAFFTMSFDVVSPPSGNRTFAIYNVLITTLWEKVDGGE